MVDVEHATDAEFDHWIKQHGVRIKNGKAGDLWVFEDRCDVINFVMKRGIKLRFLASNNSLNNFSGNCLEVSQMALEVSQDSSDVSKISAIQSESK